MIEVQDLTKYFGNICALNNISFTAESGDIVGLVGPNGAGKTTLLRILGCYIPPSQGKIIINDYDIQFHSYSIRKNLGYFQEKVSIYPEMRVYGFLNFMSQVKKVPKTERKRKIYEIMESCGLLKVGQRIIGHLSKGYQQRVGLAQSLLNDPQLLLLDEPTAGVDPSQSVEIRNIIRNFKADRTVILCSHILSEISQLCNKIIILNKGQIITADTSSNLYKNLNQDNEISIQIETNCHSNVIPELKGVQGVKEVRIKEKDSSFCNTEIETYILKTDLNINLFQQVCRLAYSNNWIINDFQTHKLTLEDILKNLLPQKNTL